MTAIGMETENRCINASMTHRNHCNAMHRMSSPELAAVLLCSRAVCMTVSTHPLYSSSPTPPLSCTTPHCTLSSTYLQRRPSRWGPPVHDCTTTVHTVHTHARPHSTIPKYPGPRTTPRPRTRARSPHRVRFGCHPPRRSCDGLEWWRNDLDVDWGGGR